MEPSGTWRSALSVPSMRSRSIQLPGKGCDPSLVRFYMAEVDTVIPFEV